MSDEIDLWRYLPRPQPPDDLRERALRRARLAWREEPAVHWVDRAWASRRLRLAWLTAAVALLAANLWLTPGALPELSRPGLSLVAARWAAEQLSSRSFPAAPFATEVTLPTGSLP